MRQFGVPKRLELDWSNGHKYFQRREGRIGQPHVWRCEIHMMLSDKLAQPLHLSPDQPVPDQHAVEEFQIYICVLYSFLNPPKTYIIDMCILYYYD